MDKSLGQILDSYQPTPATINLVKQTPILLLVGPSGAGKDSLKSSLLATGKYHHIVSHTSRPPRVNHGVKEREGHEYHFIDDLAAKRMLEEQAFVEAKQYSGNIYGTSVAEIQAAHDAGKIALTDLEVQGIETYKSIDPDIIAVFLLPPDFDTWQDRLRRRYGDNVDHADVRRRMQAALRELDQLLSTDYYFAVINADLGDTLSEVQAIVDTRSHDPQLEAAARQLAGELAKATEAYLGKTSTLA